MTEKEYEDLKKEARKRYPVGCKIRDTVNDIMIIKYHSFRIDTVHLINAKGSSLYVPNNSPRNAYLYDIHSKKWAEVIEYPKVSIDVFF